MRLCELQDKDVINVRDCTLLGHVCDLIFDEKTCCILSLVIPGPSKCFGLLGNEYEYIVPCRCICQIGCDIILVDVCLEEIRQ